MPDGVTTAALDAWVRAFARLVAEKRDELTRLDAAIGDADHGSNLDRGLRAAVAALDDGGLDSPKALLTKVGMTLVSTVGGASGPLYGTLFLRIGTALGEEPEADPARFAAAMRAGLDGVVARGKAGAGDKTMVDALAPAVEALEAAVAAGAGFEEALEAAGRAAETGCAATVPLLARKGRASYLGERSVGHQDPGATSTALLFRAALDAGLDSGLDAGPA